MTSRIRCCALLVIASLPVSAHQAQATVFQIAISPPASQARNLAGAGFIYPGDHFIGGLAPANETSPPASLARGGALGPITFDDITKVLTMDYGYGSAFGFTDLAGDFTDTHIHGNGTNTALFPAANGSVGVTIGLLTSHVPSGARSGRVQTTRVLNTDQESWLFRNQLYFNVHSQFSQPGEVRGQLVVVPEPATCILGGMTALGLLVFRRRTA